MHTIYIPRAHHVTSACEDQSTGQGWRYQFMANPAVAHDLAIYHSHQHTGFPRQHDCPFVTMHEQRGAAMHVSLISIPGDLVSWLKQNNILSFSVRLWGAPFSMHSDVELPVSHIRNLSLRLGHFADVSDIVASLTPDDVAGLKTFHDIAMKYLPAHLATNA